MSPNPTDSEAVAPAMESKRVWSTLVTNIDYLPGLLALDFALKLHSSAYPLVALYTDTFPLNGLEALKVRGIPSKHLAYLRPSVDRDFSNDPRFQDTWTKLRVFSFTEYDRVVLMDSDMLVTRNMDELMDLELDAPSTKGRGDRVFAAAHACTCNPLKKPHYPKDWIPANCGYTTQHTDPDDAQVNGAPSTAGLGLLNGGLLVINPSTEVFALLKNQLTKEEAIHGYMFADQSLLADVFHGRWVGLPYIYNALKTMRPQDVHGTIWRDDKVKNIHYILGPKPWNEKPGHESLETHKWWTAANLERKEAERAQGIEDVLHEEYRQKGLP